MKKTVVALFFGGRSREYSVSLCSAAAVLQGLSPDRYEVVAVGITRAGHWLATTATPDEIEADRWQAGGTPCLLSPDRGRPGLLLIAGGRVKHVLPDVLFPVLHGKYGEDGCIQGLFALSGIPYVGCDTRASAIGMDKAVTKTLAAAAGIPVVPWISARARELQKRVAERVEATLTYPVFVKPSQSGSSIGAGVARDRRELYAALRRAAAVDDTILIEAFTPVREIEVAVLRIGQKTEVSRPGEIIPPEGGFYDYDTKYRASGAELRPLAHLTREQETTARARAAKIYRLLSCHGPVRVDFFLPRAGGELYFNEVNTLPGFTAISMFPRLMTANRPFPALLDALIAGARRG